MSGDYLTLKISPEAADLIDVKYNTANDPAHNELPSDAKARRVDELKRLAARMVTLLEPAQQARGRQSGRLASMAITDIEKACMVAVKAVTRSDAPA